MYEYNNVNVFQAMKKIKYSYSTFNQKNISKIFPNKNYCNTTDHNLAMQ